MDMDEQHRQYLAWANAPTVMTPEQEAEFNFGYDVAVAGDLAGRMRVVARELGSARRQEEMARAHLKVATADVTEATVRTIKAQERLNKLMAQLVEEAK